MCKTQCLKTLSIALIVAEGLGSLLLGQTTTQLSLQELPPSSTFSLQTGPYYALVIGNNNYKYLPKLQTAVNDAKAVAQLLREHYGFQTQVLLDADRNQILTALAEYRRKLSENSNLLIYYAGHSHHDRDTDKAYWLPVDALVDNNTNWINTEEITAYVRSVPASHVLVISDSYYSDTLPRDADASTNLNERGVFLTNMLNSKSRTLMVSGAKEPMTDSGSGAGHSVFTEAVLQGLHQMAYSQFTAGALFQTIQPRFAGPSSQAPQYGVIRNSGHDVGDFVFSRIATGLVQAAANTGTGQEAETRIERYPNIEAPDSIVADEEFAVQISLTAAQLAEGTRIVSGGQNDGKVIVNMNAAEDEWEIEVDLTAPGFDLRSGSSNSLLITLPRKGDSTIALFHLRAKQISGPSQLLKIYATLYHSNAFIARLERSITVLSSYVVAPSPPTTLAPQTLPIVQPPPAPLPDMLTTLTGLRPLMLTVDPKTPTLTIEESRSGSSTHLVLHSKYYGYASAEIPNTDRLRQWVKQRYDELARVGRGVSVQNTSPTPYPSDVANAFGNDLYDKFAPRAFKELFWHLHDEHGADFSSIQIISDDPVLPWELMRPVRIDSSERLQFLGLKFKIARWHIRPDALPRPPQVVSLSTLAVIAPKYGGAYTLPGTNDELKALGALPEFTAVGGDYQSVRYLATHLPDGIIHFAGHGATRSQDGVPQFFILLQDQALAPSTWQALENGRPAAHPLFFFNACDVGQIQEFMNEVEGWAPALLDSGASGYIGALWPISDQVAAKFASRFYADVAGQLVHGQADIARLLTTTRLSVYQETHDPTALAYVLYGDPELLLVPPQTTAGGEVAPLKQ
jgi:Caspase domain/CHAT domain